MIEADHGGIYATLERMLESCVRNSMQADVKKMEQHYLDRGDYI